MRPLNQNKLMVQLTKLATFLVIFWIFFLLGRSLWQNWNLKHSILKLNEQISTLQKQKKDLENLNLYYSSDSFQELEARKELGLKKPGEKMVILPTTPRPTPNNFSQEIKEEAKSIAGVESSSKIPNWLLWWQYFTK